MVVYKITNLLSLKSYIGQTTQEVSVRWKNHCKSSRKSAISFAIQKYGKENFKFEIVDNADSIEELNRKEIEWIEKEGTISPIGYNLRSGGDNSLHHEVTKQKQSLVKMGNKNPMFGKNLNDYLTSDEIIQRNEKISRTKKGKPSKSGLKLAGRTKEQFDYLKQMGNKQSLKYRNEGNPNAKRIVLNGVEYLTMKDASLKTGLSMYKLRKMYQNYIFEHQ